MRKQSRQHTATSYGGEGLRYPRLIFADSARTWLTWSCAYCIGAWRARPPALASGCVSWIMATEDDQTQQENEPSDTDTLSLKSVWGGLKIHSTLWEPTESPKFAFYSVICHLKLFMQSPTLRVSWSRGIHGSVWGVRFSPVSKWNSCLWTWSWWVNHTIPSTLNHCDVICSWSWS